ncbi:fasciclin domain-containing protein [Arthrospira sp. PCC 9108]|nr:fasciclin domain-containing protein [Arthrospira sp. PCC 9108]
MNIISLKHWSVGTAALGILALHSVAPSLAQYYPYYSFFNPMSSYYESEDDLGLAEVIGKQDRLRTLGKALQDTGLSQQLQGETYTILAPTDAAFANLPREIRDRLFRPENQGMLREILNYHVVAGRITQQQVESGEITTRQGNTVRISGNPRDQKLMLNEANADQLPIPGPNDSVIVVIDRVLLPPGLIPLGIQSTNPPRKQLSRYQLMIIPLTRLW